jgi:hypothetical protein
MEGSEWVWANGTLIEREVEIKKAVNTLARTKKLDEKHMRALFESIVAKIESQE